MLMFSLCLAGCGLLGGGGLESKECKDYFAKVDECSAKADAKGTPSAKVKAEAWKKGAEISKQNWEKNANPVAVKKGCELTLETLKNDSDCQ
jgi:hypothetical protein